MEFRLTTEQEIFKRSLREYCQKNIEPRAREIDEKEAGIPDELIKGLAELGIFGVCVPEEYGGSMSLSQGEVPIWLLSRPQLLRKMVSL